VNVLDLSTKAGLPLLKERAWQQVWMDKQFFCLRCDLTQLPEPPKAKMAIQMKLLDLAGFRGFAQEFELVSGHDAVEVFARERLREAGVQAAYLATGEDGSPAYVQWLVDATRQSTLHGFQPGRYRALETGEVLLEGAYTFTAFRGRGLMNTGMYQLLEIARRQGAHAAWTYVATENVPSLRGCARVGFLPDSLRSNHRRFRAMRTEFSPLTSEARPLWDQAVGNKVA